MSAAEKLSSPALRALLDRHFDDDALAGALGIDDRAVLDVVRRAMWRPLAEFLSRPGKEVRARLVSHAFRVAQRSGGAPEATLPEEVRLLVEALHAGSLIVDDIEDDADERRGAPALHRTHGVPVALNAGNWLYFFPLFSLERCDLRPEVALAMHRAIVATMVRCHHGQGLDVGVRVDELRPERIEGVVEATTRLKTGSLFELAARLGAIAAEAPIEVERALARFACEAGVVLQMLDDLGSLVAPSRAAKGREDLSSARPTWAWAVLAERLARSEIEELQRRLSVDDVDAVLCSMRARLADRPFARAKARLDDAVSALRAALFESVELDALVRDVRRLEHAYG